MACLMIARKLLQFWRYMQACLYFFNIRQHIPRLYSSYSLQYILFSNKGSNDEYSSSSSPQPGYRPMRGDMQLQRVMRRLFILFSLYDSSKYLMAVSYYSNSQWMTPMKKRISDHLNIYPQSLQNSSSKVKFQPYLPPKFWSQASCILYISSVISRRVISESYKLVCVFVDDFFRDSRQVKSNFNLLIFCCYWEGQLGFLE